MLQFRQLQAKFRGALLGVAIGDAVGAPYAGLGAAGIRSGTLAARRPGILRYTDDTQMTMGVAEALLERAEFDGAHLAAILARNYAAEPWRGYGAGARQIFLLLAQGVPWDQAAGLLFDGAGSYGNGAATRVAPIALLAYRDLARVAALARRAAEVTHAHEHGQAGAVLQAVALARLLRQPAQCPLATGDFLQELRGHVRAPVYLEKLDRIQTLLVAGTIDDVTAQLGTGPAAREAVPTALYAFLRHQGSFADAVDYAVSLGGETDTIASMTGALAGAYLGEPAIPAAAREKLEGAACLRHLADGLLGRATGSSLGGPPGRRAEEPPRG